MTKLLISLPSKLIIAIIRLYQMAISPFLPKVCRFQPTCSSYAVQAFQRYPMYKALYLSIWRILRCNPLFRGGYDPLP